MHNLALALDNQGHIVTGSDDQIFEPALTRLTTHGLLPIRMGWYPDYDHLHAHARIQGTRQKF